MFLALGLDELGIQPLAGDPLHDPPSISINPIGAVTTGGPQQTISWVFTQAQGDPQEQYRVVISSDVGEVFYDSGWIESDSNQVTVDVDEEGIPHNSELLEARVSARGPEAIGVGELARYRVDGLVGLSFVWGAPHCTITGPADESIHTALDGLTVSWAFSDDAAGKTQSAYRARLLLEGSELVEWDTGWVEDSGATSYEFPVNLRDGSRYVVELQLKNNHGIRSD